MSEEREKSWSEEELQNLIAQSAEEQPIPDSLLPEQVVERLKEEQKATQKKAGKKRSRQILHLTEAAAAIALVAAIGGIGIRMISSGTGNMSGMASYDMANTAESANESSCEAASAQSADGTGTVSETETFSSADMLGYHVASDYEEIYELIQQNQAEISIIYDSGYSGGEVDIAEEGSDSIADSVALGSTAQVEHSQTNVQQEGVDESDVAKTDGSYIYQVLSDNTLAIIDIRGDKMALSAEITPDAKLLDTVEEIYVDGNRLYVVGTRTDAGLSSYDTDDGPYYYSGYEVSTVLLTYDITDRQNPVQLGSYTQDGSYYTSRKVGDYIYLFTRNDLYNSCFDDVMEAIPCVQEQPVPCSSIYISEHAYTDLVISSVNTVQPEQSADQMMILDDFSSIYMGTSAIYIYKSAYVDAQSMTHIMKFSYEDGTFAPVAAALVRGSITDTFAISENQGMLRVLTTDWSAAEEVNQLYILDEQMQQTGVIDGIAEGESVYAARYIGDIAYFITYRNMDPLFVADLSDPSNPVLLGSAAISGFSDYLHVYEDHLVLGIGYETDESSYVEGVKLVMFDVSDPLNPQVVTSCVLGQASGTSADRDYKSILVDAEKGIIGFLTESWSEAYSCDYRLFTWNGEAFLEEADIPLSKEGQYDQSVMDTRGLYAGDTFYLVSSKSVVSYDMAHDFAKVDELNYSK
jgi:uncharacterized secreted protein with C-terminal beta-propeller domain